jgi:hypothetical protein
MQLDALKSLADNCEQSAMQIKENRDIFIDIYLLLKKLESSLNLLIDLLFTLASLTTNIMEEIIKQGTHHPKFDFSSSYLQ